MYMHMCYSTWKPLVNNSAVEALDSDTELLMVPRPVYWLYDGNPERAYGKCTYNSVVRQTDAGLAKFYSIIYYIVIEFCGHVMVYYMCATIDNNPLSPLPPPSLETEQVMNFPLIFAQM